MTQKGFLVVVSGFSGGGKGTVMKAFLERHSEYGLSISATTRTPRDGEADGREYFFLSKEAFEKKIDDGELYEYNNYNGNYYGTLRSYVDNLRSMGRDVILEIEVNGARKIKQQFPDTILIFLTPPSAGELERRLIGRGSETKESTRNRLNTAVIESAAMSDYDYILINDQVEECAEALHTIIQTEHRRSGRMRAFIAGISDELNLLMKGEQKK